MARTTRRILDMALVSLDKTQPAIAKAWDTTKSYVMDTRAKSLVCNRYVERMEDSISRVSESLSSKLKDLRDQQLPAEVEYLEKELDKVKKKLCENDEKGENLN